ncbi:DHA2 family efflux MFS transporter permease subunit [Amycolatopsis albispora]|uniref:Multidrug transporter n=1 Tax=Amycolatopsis albispora TaxID=1804986 RepID=A0A344LIY8_9PSEU|nr:DHA2 family efflux MFS transporter permease subunit [Amycolatopsis albispora]AXB48012.1 multidrug transporter [Amycolatopsis albispora]
MIPTRTWKIAAVTGLGALLAMLDSTLVNLAVEAVRADLGSTLPVVQWIVTGYLVALAVSLPASGWLGGRFGYGRVWTVALAVFVLASALCALAPGVPALIAARVLQGLAAGLLVPAGQAVLGAVAGPAQLGRLMGALGVVVSLGPAVGPALGGLLLDLASWRWLFWLNLPIGLFALAAARGLVPPGERDHTRPLDLTGLVLLGGGLPLLLYGATSRSIPLLLAGGVLIAWFARTPRSLLDLRLLRDRRFAAATVTTGFTGANMYAGLLLLPLFLQLDAGLDSTATGLQLLAMGLGSAGALYFGGALTDRHGAGLVTLAGAVLLVVTTLPFLLPLPVPVLTALLVVRGAALALAQLPATTAAYASVTADRLGDATTLVNIVQRAGGAIGAAGIAVLLTQSGYGWGFGALAVLSGLTVASAAVLHTGAR